MSKKANSLKGHKLEGSINDVKYKITLNRKVKIGKFGEKIGKILILSNDKTKTYLNGRVKLVKQAAFDKAKLVSAPKSKKLKYQYQILLEENLALRNELKKLRKRLMNVKTQTQT
jgi:hypothetical protein